MKKRIYLDNNATTFLDARILEKMITILSQEIGNPSSIHSFGQEAKALLTKARRNISSSLNIKAEEIVFTSGGTESLNMIIQGLFNSHYCGHIITSDVEHDCVYQTIKLLEKKGCRVSYLPAGTYGAVSADAVKQAIEKDTRLITLMAVNNVTGVKTNYEDIASIAEEKQIPFVVDAVALMGKELFSIPKGVSAMCFSSHKFHGPQGTGMAFIRPSLKFDSLLKGGGQENQKRAGTENLSGIVGMAEAIKLLSTELPEASKRMLHLRNLLENLILQKLSNVSINGEGPRVVNTTNLCFEGIDAESLIMNLDLEGIAASHGSACSSGGLKPSRILLNMGISNKKAKNSIRLSLSRFTTEQEIYDAAKIIIDLVSRLQKIGIKNP